MLKGKENYQVWPYTLKNHLKTAGLVQFITRQDEEVKIDHPDQMAKPTVDRSQEAKSMILSTLSKSEVRHIIHCDTAYDIWSNFENAYGKKTSKMKLELMNELNAIGCKSAAEVSLSSTKP